MNPLKKLAGDTIIYGFTTILGRFVNWLLVPLYAGIFPASEYGIVTNLMSYIALLMVILTYGTETGFFRFSTKDNSNKVFSTLMFSLTGTTLLFFIVAFSFLPGIADFLEIPDHKNYLTLLILTIGIDAISSIPFALLRLQGRPIRFGVVKLVNVGVNIALNLFFLYCVLIWKKTEFTYRSMIRQEGLSIFLLPI